MNPDTATEIVKALRKASDLYREAALQACAARQPWDVYHAMKESMALESRARRIAQRYADVK